MQEEIKAVLFDADGVLTVPEEVFSLVYSKSHGLDTEPFEIFFKTEWQKIVTGKKDLKQSISENPALWQWNGTPESLLEYWFKAEDVRNEELLNLIPKIRTKGLHCYLATDQEYYRGEYMKQVMFKDLFDGFFISADLGVVKKDPKFFELIVKELKNVDPTIQAGNILFFDDSQSKVDSAKSVGLVAHLYTGTQQVKSLLLG